MPWVVRSGALKSRLVLAATVASVSQRTGVWLKGKVEVDKQSQIAERKHSGVGKQGPGDRRKEAA